MMKVVERMIVLFLHEHIFLASFFGSTHKICWERSSISFLQADFSV